MKLERHAVILRLVRERRIANQDELRQALGAEGIAVAQATLSRDIRELGLVKQADPGGGGFYVVPAEGPPRPGLAATLETWLLGMEGVGPLLVLRAQAGGAAAVALAIEQAGWSEVVAALPGGDNVLVVTRNEAARKALERRIGQPEGRRG